VLSRVMRAVHARFPTMPALCRGQGNQLRGRAADAGKNGRPAVRASRHRARRHQSLLRRSAMADAALGSLRAGSCPGEPAIELSRVALCQDPHTLGIPDGDPAGSQDREQRLWKRQSRDEERAGDEHRRPSRTSSHGRCRRYSSANASRSPSVTAARSWASSRGSGGRVMRSSHPRLVRRVERGERFTGPERRCNEFRTIGASGERYSLVQSLRLIWLRSVRMLGYRLGK